MTKSATLRLIVLLQHRLIALQFHEIDDIIESGFAHGWVSHRTKEISDMRGKIDKAKKDLKNART